MQRPAACRSGGFPVPLGRATRLQIYTKFRTSQARHFGKLPVACSAERDSKKNNLKILQNSEFLTSEEIKMSPL